MKKRNIMMIIIVSVTVLLSNVVMIGMKSNANAEKIKKEANANWKWEDNWNSDSDPKSEEAPKPVEKKPETPKEQIVASSYREAIQKSGELGRPVFAFFTADWCGFCRKMKSETLSDKKIAEMLKDYIVVYVDTDKDRVGVNKFNVSSLPSYVITNHKEENLKFGSGHMNVENFAKWIDNPKLIEQPKVESSTPKVVPDDNKKEDGHRRSKRLKS